MTLKIDPTTEQGKNYIEAIKWSQDQMNAILVRYFNDKYRIMKGLLLEFIIKTGSAVQEDVKVEIAELAPRDIKHFKEAVEQAKKELGLTEEVGVTTIIQDAQVVSEKGKQYGTGKK